MDHSMPGTIVVGFDGSDHADDALALGRLLATASAAELVVVCAYPDDPLGDSATAAELAQGMREDAEAHLARAREIIGAQGSSGFRAIAGASPSQVLHELAEQLRARTIVVGPTHHGTALRRLTGSTPEHVLNHAPCPVAVAPDGYARRAAGALRRISVAYDGGDESQHALAAAAALARDTGARLRLVNVVNAAAVGMYPPLDVSTYDELAQLTREEARGRLAAAAADLDGIAVETDVLDGEPDVALVEDSHADDILFAGSRGHGPFRRVLVGSVSSHLLREAVCPVVIVPRGSGEGA
jgi:nucleotide-binding universal stress UspA family protein